jgi:hypothetical protein
MSFIDVTRKPAPCSYDGGRAVFTGAIFGPLDIEMGLLLL